MRASAPGKLHLAGEYAVLDGAPAVVMAIDRRAVATLVDQPGARSPLLEELETICRARFGAGSAQAERAARVVVDSSRLQIEVGEVGGAGTPCKLGVGSSSAAAVAAAAVVLGHGGCAIVTELATVVHAAAQARRGAAGSGADVAVAATGGVIAFRRGAPAQALTLPAGLVWVPVWLGAAADTPTLVAAVEAGRAAQPTAVGAALAAIGAASRALVGACVADDAGAAMAAVAAGDAAMQTLAAATGAPLVPPALAAIRDVARRHGGVAKTTGAGGGDVAVLALPALGPAEMVRVRNELAATGLTVLDLAMDPRGVDFAAGAE